MVDVVVSLDYAFDFRDVNVSRLQDGVSYVRETNYFGVTYDDGTMDEFFGRSFTYGDDGLPDGGKVKYFNYQPADADETGKFYTAFQHIGGKMAELMAAAKTGGNDDDIAFFKSHLQGKDVVYGGDLGDRLYGFDGDDVIRARQGSDVIIGGKGADNLFAGKDDVKDVFKFKGGDSGTEKGSWDQIYQFDRKNGDEKGTDKIDLSALHVHLSDLSFDTKGNTVKVSIDTHGSDKADMVIEVMHTSHLTQEDFIL